MNKNKKALKCLNMALKIDPNFKTAQEHRQIVINRTKKKKEPQVNNALFRQKLADMHNSGSKLMAMKRFPEALLIFEEAVRIAPLFSQAWAIKAVCHYEMGDLSRALTSVEESLRLEPRNEDAWYNKGQLIVEIAESKGGKYDFRDDFNKAIECYDRVLKLNPRHQPALNNKGILLWKSGRKEEYEAYRKESKKFLDD